MFQESWVTTVRVFGSPSPELAELPQPERRLTASNEQTTERGADGRMG